MFSEARREPFEMVAALGQDDQRAALGREFERVACNQFRSLTVVGECTVDLLDRGVGRERGGIEARVSPHHAQREPPPGCGRLAVDRMSHRATLHRDDGVVSVAAVRGGGQASHVARGRGLQDLLNRDGGDVVAFVDDDMAVLAEQAG